MIEIKLTRASKWPSLMSNGKSPLRPDLYLPKVSCAVPHHGPYLWIQSRKLSTLVNIEPTLCTVVVGN